MLFLFFFLSSFLASEGRGSGTAKGRGGGGRWEGGRLVGRCKGQQVKFVACLLAGVTSQQHASTIQGRISGDSCMCRHTEVEAAGKTCHLTPVTVY